MPARHTGNRGGPRCRCAPRRAVDRACLDRETVRRVDRRSCCPRRACRVAASEVLRGLCHVLAPSKFPAVSSHFASHAAAKCRYRGCRSSLGKVGQPRCARRAPFPCRPPRTGRTAASAVRARCAPQGRPQRRGPASAHRFRDARRGTWSTTTRRAGRRARQRARGCRPGARPSGLRRGSSSEVRPGAPGNASRPPGSRALGRASRCRASEAVGSLLEQGDPLRVDLPGVVIPMTEAERGTGKSPRVQPACNRVASRKVLRASFVSPALHSARPRGGAGHSAAWRSRGLRGRGCRSRAVGGRPRPHRPVRRMPIPLPRE